MRLYLNLIEQLPETAGHSFGAISQKLTKLVRATNDELARNSYTSTWLALAKSKLVIYVAS